MASAASSANVANLFRALKKNIESEDDAAIVKTADQILAANGGDKDALHAKAVALIRSSRFQEALTALESLTDLRFERAYCLYRTTRYAECQAALAAIPQQDRTDGVAHLEAQLNYRLGNFPKAAEGFEKLAAKDPDAEAVTNVLAAHVSAGNTQAALKFAQGYKNLEASSYEIAYNTACALIEAGEFKSARAKLEQAKKLCQNTMEAEERTAEDLADEVAIMRVQGAYISQLSGEGETAHSIYTEVLNAKPSDPAVVATASNNLVTLRKKDEKLFDSVKRIERAAKVPTEKLSQRQKIAIQSNQCLLSLYGKKYDKCRESAEAIRKEFPWNDFPVLVLAAMHLREKNADKAEEVLSSFLAENKESVQAHLTLAQVKLSQNKFDEAISILQSTAFRHRPATVATSVALYEEANKADQAGKVLEDAVAHWESVLKSNASDSTAQSALLVLLEKLAQFYASSGQNDKALSLFQRLADQAKAKDPQYVAKAVASAASVDSALSAKLVAQLPKVPGLDQIDIKSLEQIEGPKPSRPAAGGSKAPQADVALSEYNPRIRGDPSKAPKVQKDDSEEEQKKKTRKKKRKRLPKNFDPNNPGSGPDPERWLPKFDRSYFKKARNRKKKNQLAGGAQGAMPTAESVTPAVDNTVKGKLPPPKSAGKGGRRRK